MSVWSGMWGCDLVDYVFPLAQISVGDGAVVPGACTLSDTYQDVVPSENVCDLVV